MPDLLDTIEVEMTDAAREYDASIVAQLPPEQETIQEPSQDAPEPADVEAPTIDSQDDHEAAPEGSDSEAIDVKDKRLARLANDAREKNRQLAEMRSEIERLKGIRTETRDQEIDRLADERARVKVAAKEFETATYTIFNNGMSSFGPRFKQALDSLNDVCADPDRVNQLCDGVIAAAGSNDGHLLIKHLGDNPDVLEDIVKLPAIGQGIELAKLAIKLTAPKIRPVSQAPAPTKGVRSTSTKTSVSNPGELPMDEFVKWSKENMRR